MTQIKHMVEIMKMARYNKAPHTDIDPKQMATIYAEALTEAGYRMPEPLLPEPVAMFDEMDVMPTPESRQAVNRILRSHNQGLQVAGRVMRKGYTTAAGSYVPPSEAELDDLLSKMRWETQAERRKRLMRGVRWSAEQFPFAAHLRAVFVRPDGGEQWYSMPVGDSRAIPDFIARATDQIMEVRESLERFSAGEPK